MIEDLGHKTAARLKRAIANSAVIAWRIMLMTLLGREPPDLPAGVFFSDLELEVLEAFAKTRRELKHLGPATRLYDATLVVTLDATLVVAKLGGYFGRKHDGPPGYQLMWYGYIELRSMIAGYALGRSELS